MRTHVEEVVFKICPERTIGYSTLAVDLLKALGDELIVLNYAKSSLVEQSLHLARVISGKAPFSISCMVEPGFDKFYLEDRPDQLQALEGEQNGFTLETKIVDIISLQSRAAGLLYRHLAAKDCWRRRVGKYKYPLAA